MHKIKVVGLGPGHKDYLLPSAKKAIDRSDLVIGGKRHLESIDLSNQETYCSDGRLSQLPDYIREKSKNKNIVVVVSGDTGFYSLLKFLKKQLCDIDMEVIPGISSMQYMFSKVGLSWDDAFIGSVHGRELDIVSLVKEYKKVGLLTDDKNKPQNICARLLEAGIDNKVVLVGENLSYDHEVISKYKINEVLDKTFNSLNVMLIIDEDVYY